MREVGAAGLDRDVGRDLPEPLPLVVFDGDECAGDGDGGFEGLLVPGRRGARRQVEERFAGGEGSGGVAGGESLEGSVAGVEVDKGVGVELAQGIALGLGGVEGLEVASAGEEGADHEGEGDRHLGGAGGEAGDDLGLFELGAAADEVAPGEEEVGDADREVGHVPAKVVEDVDGDLDAEGLEFGGCCLGLGAHGSGGDQERTVGRRFTREAEWPGWFALVEGVSFADGGEEDCRHGGSMESGSGWMQLSRNCRQKGVHQLHTDVLVCGLLRCLERDDVLGDFGGGPAGILRGSVP